MVERNIDKKIRTLRIILDATDRHGTDKIGRPYLYRQFHNSDVNVSELELQNILYELKLSIKREDKIRWEDEDGAPTGPEDYVIEILFDGEIKNGLAELLKQLESQAPKREKSLIREKSLELISQRIGNLDSGPNLVKFLRDCGVDEELILYPNTKWRMIFDALVYLSYSAKDKDQQVFSKIIGEATHPLMNGGNKERADALREEFNTYLKYDRRGIAYNNEDGTYWALPEAGDDEPNIEADEYIDHLEKKNEEQLIYLSRPENKGKISLLRKSYQLLMNVVEAFCEETSRPTEELNKGYQFLYGLINSTIRELNLWHDQGLKGTPYCRTPHFSPLPFSNLFTAEQTFGIRGEELSWSKLRPGMYAMYGNIDDIYNEINGSDVLAEPDKQGKLNDIQLLLSVLKKKREIAESKVRHQMRARANTQSAPTTKIEITSLPELHLKGLEERVVLVRQKNNKIQLQNFPQNMQWEEISIRFLNEQEVIINAGDRTFQTNYEAMGFQDGKRKLPDKQWNLLRLLAFKKGMLSWENNNSLSIKDINKVKKQKQLLSESLKTFFQIIDSEPFYDYKNENAYKIKLKLIPDQESVTGQDQAISEEGTSDLKEYYKEQAPETDG